MRKALNRLLFSPMVSGWAGGRWEKVCPGYISETVWCRKLIFGRDIGWGVGGGGGGGGGVGGGGGRCATSWCDLPLTLP